MRAESQLEGKFPRTVSFGDHVSPHRLGTGKNDSENLYFSRQFTENYLSEWE
ncbi:hypothetical protein Hbor_05080 [Halogeometricum borinquense DSM 11551]|uniref:Uncharacterized protein n=1 Tax=Halogeometricum borinquense (strain ATCC 700274 / DSM 11551 / JCM 10706 / KCTC 4070 / PR3) TaxID=469382 RepID=E4NM10_HALBP|nr:hypothetical protein Hbor_05080 [Halogeometricum borinquense DSM 11551]